MKKVLKKIKDIIMMIFGRAWPFLIALSVFFLFVVIELFIPGTSPYLTGLSDNESWGFVNDFEPEDIYDFSINDQGTTFILSSQFSDLVISEYDHDTQEKIYTSPLQVNVDISDDDYFYPYNIAATDNGVVYALRKEYYEFSSDIFLKESVVRLTEDFKYIGTVCEINYDVTKKQRHTKISELHYFDGTVTFSVLEDDGVWLYSIDTDSQALSKSEFYPTDPNGTYTAKVIPLDGSFLFIRSDGNVYNVRFNEPYDNPIYHFEINAEQAVDHPVFTAAVLVNGKLYVADKTYSDAVYLLENGELEKVFDISEEYGLICSMNAYKGSLIVCLEQGLLSYSDGEVRDDTPVIHYDPKPLMYIEPIIGYLTLFSIAGLIINLIIRKKTLLYKQMILIVPIIIVISIIIAVKVFSYYEEKTTERINNDLTVICDLTKKQFDGYDFSALMSANEDTGSAYSAISRKFANISSNSGNDWSNEYIFKIVYRTTDDYMIDLVSDDMICLPLCMYEDGDFSDLADTTEGLYIDNSIEAFLSDDYYGSKISVLGQIADKNNTGRYYLLVTTDTSSLYTQRSDLFARVIIYSFLAIVALIIIILLSALNTMRVIKKASKTVKKLSKGDLSARVNYRSNDELGQICSEVNEMGQNLEKLFDEKDKTERFYYKFVPEKFRELLGKENFTDLELGDAKSCELTVLFTDIRGFSINSEMMTAKENFAFANIIYGKMGPIVRKNNGFVDKYIGDAVMGLFENADDAVRCGIELYRSIVLDPKTAEELNVSDINIGIGVHTGMAMVGIVGEAERLSGTVISETVNMSSRLESLTKQYHTAMLVSKSTIDRMKDPDSLDLRYLGIVQVAGVNEVEALYEVLDCLPENVKGPRSANNQDLKEAIRLFALGRRGEAVSALQQIESSGRSDYVSDLYLNYIKNMSDDDKANVFRFVRK